MPIKLPVAVSCFLEIGMDWRCQSITPCSLSVCTCHALLATYKFATRNVSVCIMRAMQACIIAQMLSRCHALHLGSCKLLMVQVCQKCKVSLPIQFQTCVPCHYPCRYHRMERSTQFVRRTVRMPETANLDQIKAKYDNGVLQLNIPKKEDERPGQRVAVQ